MSTLSSIEIIQNNQIQCKSCDFYMHKRQTLKKIPMPHATVIK